MTSNKQDGSNPTTGASLSSNGSADSRDYVGKDALVDFRQLRFIAPDEERRFTAARSCFAARAATWEHFPLRMIGNFVEENWCRGEGAARGCAGGGFTERAGVDWANVNTLHYPKDWPAVFGLGMSAGRNRPHGDSGWSVAFSISSNGKSIIGDGVHVSFRRDKDTVLVGSGYEWTIAERRFSQSAEEDPWTLFERIRSAPDAFREEGVTHWRALEKEVVAALEANDVRKCVYGEYKGDGIPPACIDRVPLDAAQKKEELNKIRSTTARIIELLEKENVAMHTALLELAPKECF